MPGEEQKDAQKFYKNLRLKGSKYQFKNSLEVQIKCFGISFPKGHAELHERDIIVGLVEMIGPEPSFEDLVVRLGLEAFDKVDAVMVLQNPLKMFGNSLLVRRSDLSSQTNTNKIFTQPKIISTHHLSVTCGLCKPHSLLKVASIILVVGDQATVHGARKRFRCKQCRAYAQAPF